MKTTKFFATLTVAFMMMMPSFSSAQEYYLWVDFLPGTSDNAYFQDWALCWQWATGRSIFASAPSMGDKITPDESLIISASEIKDPSFSFTLTTDLESALPRIESQIRDKSKFPMKLALCNSKGEPEGMYLLSNAMISSYKENDDKLDLAVTFEELKFTSVESEFEFNQEIFLWVEGIEGSATDPDFKEWIEVLSVSYDLPYVPSKMALLKENPRDFKPRKIAADECNRPEMIMDFGKWVDKSSAALLNYYSDKKIFPAKVAIVNKNANSYIVLEMLDVIVTSRQEHNADISYTFEFEGLEFSVEEK